MSFLLAEASAAPRTVLGRGYGLSVQALTVCRRTKGLGHEWWEPRACCWCSREKPLERMLMKKAGLTVSECLHQEVVRNEVGQGRGSPLTKALQNSTENGLKN